MYDFIYTSSKKPRHCLKIHDIQKKKCTSKLAASKKKKLQNLGVQLITSNPKLPFHSGLGAVQKSRRSKGV